MEKMKQVETNRRSRAKRHKSYKEDEDEDEEEEKEKGRRRQGQGRSKDVVEGSEEGEDEENESEEDEESDSNEQNEKQDNNMVQGVPYLEWSAFDCQFFSTHLPTQNIQKKSGNWEDELAQLIKDFDKEVTFDGDLKKQLLNYSVKEFNKRVRQINLDPNVVEWLKLQRKRLKNRQAAVRSRYLRENKSKMLQTKVDQLLVENEANSTRIKELEHYLSGLEKQLISLQSE